jgi:hypothetical protein
MELKALDIINKFEALNKLADKETDLSTAIIIAKNLKELSTYKEIIDKKRDSVIVKYAEKNDNNVISQDENGNVKITDINSFNKDLSEILDTPIEVNLLLLPKDKMMDMKISAKDILPLTDILDGDV